MIPDLAQLERILWCELVRAAGDPSRHHDPHASAARAIRAVLSASELHAEELEIVERWDARRETGRVLLDRLMTARVNRAVRVGCAAESERLGHALPAPRVVVVRASATPRPPHLDSLRKGRPGATLVEVLEATGSLDLAELAPGARIDELVDLLVLANRDAAEELAASDLRASFQRADDDGAIDLVELRSPSVRVVDVERALLALEELLLAVIPHDRRPAPQGELASVRDLRGELLGGKYRVKALKGRGAFKTVYEGEDEMLGARVAIAVLNPRGARSQRALARFQDEARLLTTLEHENIVRWITFDRTPGGLHYFVMEYLDGEELEQVLRREGRLAPARVAQILLQVLAALKRAHASGGERGALLHLDLKPENVFLLPARLPGEPERVKVIDFGIGQHVGAEARAQERADEPDPDGAASEPAAALAPSGASPRVARARGGTLLYASPEQCRHLAGELEIEPLDGRSDLYSCGVMAFRMLTGEFPFADCSSVRRAISNHLEVEPRKVGSRGVAVPRALAAFVDRCLVKDRTRRFQDAAEALAALERIVHSRRAPLALALSILAVASLAVGWLYATRSAPTSALTLVDPHVTDVAARVVSALSFGPRASARELEVETDFAWEENEPPVPRLLDAGGGGAPEGWEARWIDVAGRRLVIEAGTGARSRAVVLELADSRRTWRTPRVALKYLGAWRIASVEVEGHDGARLLDPRGRQLVVWTDGDAEGRTALESMALFDAEGTLLARASAQASEQGERARHEGLALDELFTGEARAVELRVRARDRAGQEEELVTQLSIAGLPADFAAGTGLVASAAPDAARLPENGETRVLLPGNALRIQATARSRARVFVEPEPSPRVVRDLAQGGADVLALAELGLDGEELRGTLRIELTDDPWVERAAPSLATKRIAFLYTPQPPSLEVALRSGASEHMLPEAESGEVARLNVQPAVRLLVRPPPESALWLEGGVARDGTAPSELARLERRGGVFELPLELAEEGPRRIALRSHVLLAGDERGPWIPPEHAYWIEVDRTAPAVELELADPAPARLGEEPVFTAALPAVRARVEERGTSRQRWSLARPDAEVLSGMLDGATEHELGPLVAEALGAAPSDGRYELELEATDEAGNVARARIGWQVAREGPRLSLLEPQASDEGRRWALGTGKAWNVVVRAEDRNGVAAVDARVVCGERVTSELALVAGEGGLWELASADRPSVRSWWAGRELVLELRARDRAGRESQAAWRGVVPDFPRPSKLVIAPRDGRGAPMVEVPAGIDYAFGGRNGENRGARAWNVPVPGASFSSYFLDAREVSRAEFLAFIESEDGYASRRWWGATDTPDEARRADWRTRLVEDSERAVAGVTWSEAAAYAAWRGKRLPTLVEWEFAVRGDGYREEPASAGLVVPGAPDWPRNLCTGVREWTGTPAQLGTGDFGTQARRNVELLLRSDGPAHGSAEASASAHWIVGSPAGTPASWAARSIRPDRDEQLRAEVGFRCALDRADALERLERGEYEETE